MKIDLVYLWVDGADPVWRMRRASYINGVDQSDNETFCAGRIANSDELRYSLRSVDMYAPWINHIYIVTDNQCPKWLDTQNSKVTIVDHKDIFPQDVLPLYNSVAIEQGIHNIEGLSEHYLYANDDMMFGREVTPDLFFTSEGVAKCHFLKSNILSKPEALNSTYNNTIKMANDAIVRDFGLDCSDWTPHHQINAYTKSSVKRCVERYKKWSEATVSNRFRAREDMQRHIFSLYAVATGEAIAVINKRPKFLGLRVVMSSLLGVGSKLRSACLAIHKKSTIKRLRYLKPSLLCINDTPQTTVNDRAEIRSILDEVYPKKSQFENFETDKPQKVDLVYLWVDGSDVEWQKRKNKYLHGVDQSDKESFCEGRSADNDELRYSLRSVEKYAPWINHIYIVTDGQCPAWLNTNNPKISIVNHRDILPTEALPTYNSCGLELAIHRIKGLSEHYLYANDDMMFGRPISPSFFFTADGKPKCRFNISKRLSYEYKRLGTHMCCVKKATRTIIKDLGLNCHTWATHHQIDPYKKSSVVKCIDAYKDWSEETINNRFRTREDMQRHIFSLYAVATGDGIALINNKKSRQKIKRAIMKTEIFLGINKGVTSFYTAINNRHIKNNIKNYRPALLCFNDSEKVSDENRAYIKTLFNDIFPNKSNSRFCIL